MTVKESCVLSGLCSKSWETSLYQQGCILKFSLFTLGAFLPPNNKNLYFSCYCGWEEYNNFNITYDPKINEKFKCTLQLLSEKLINESDPTEGYRTY